MWTYKVEGFGAQVPLPRHDERVRTKKWAIDAARAVAERSPYQPVPEGEVSLVVHDLMWLFGHYRGLPQADFADAWIQEPRFGVDAFSTMSKLTADDSLASPEDVSTFNVTPGRPVQPRRTHRTSYPAGTAGVSYSVVEGVFCGEPHQVRHLNHFLFLRDQPGGIVTLHFEWQNWEVDDAIRETAEMIMASLVVEPVPAHH